MCGNFHTLVVGIDAFKVWVRRIFFIIRSLQFFDTTGHEACMVSFEKQHYALSVCVVRAFSFSDFTTILTYYC